LRESEAYGLKNGDLYQQGAIRIQRSWYRGDINPTKTNEIRDVGIGAEIFERLIAWIATLPERSDEGWVFPSERIVKPLLPDNVLRRCIYPRYPRLDPLGLDWINFAVLRRFAFNTARGSRHEPEDHCGSTGARPGSSS
jgi:hypothetical protein